MKIGQLVKSYTPKIFHYCDTEDHEELARLMDEKYSKKTFDINFPFCTESSAIPVDLSKRYWTTSYLVRGKTVRVSSQWYETHVSKSRDLFLNYLLSKGIVTEEEQLLNLPVSPVKGSINDKEDKSPSSNSRYKGNAIGNAQNLVIRNILSNLGQESFTQEDWKETKAFFSNRCAYCSVEDKLLMEHAVPINRSVLGEHRLGNLVPSCKSCNFKKASQTFNDFLSDNPEKIKKIEEYMDSRNYVPLGDNEQVKMILEMAYQEVKSLADRYIAILNELFPV